MAHRRHPRGRQYQRLRVMISLTNVARSFNEEEDGDVEISRSPLFPSPRVSRLTLNSPRNVTACRQCGNSAAIRRQKNRTYHNGMRGARAGAIVEALWQFFDVQSTGSSIAIPPLRLAAELRFSRGPRRHCIPTYVSGRLTRDNRFYDYALPRCEPIDACTAS